MRGSRKREMQKVKDDLVCTMVKRLEPYSFTGTSGTGTQDDPCSIHRVPPNIRKGDPGSYEPQILSIGPYHHRNPELHAMEEHKWRYLHNLLRRKHQEVEEYIEAVTTSGERAQSYYSEPRSLGDHDFLKMMVLDGCFIVELLLRFNEQIPDDPILAGWKSNVVRRDILKLENQIPFFILEELFNVAVGPGATDPSLRQHAFYYLMLRKADETPLPEHKIYHLLHFYDVILLPKSPDTSTNTRSSSSFTVQSESPNTSTNTLPSSSTNTLPSSSFTVQSESPNTSTNTIPSSSFPVQSILEKMRRFTSRSFTLPTWRKPKPTSNLPQFTIPCVVKLEEMGIKLRRKPAESFLDDVTFQDGTLSIPPLSIDDNTNSVFRNLVALEQCRPDVGRHFTQYVVFLDCIVNTPQDVSILQNRGIVEYRLGSEEEVAKLINRLGKEITIYPTNEKLVKLFRDVNQHCQSRWYKHRARFMRDYFSSPWSTISLVAAVFLLLMTAAQVVLAVLSYNKQ